MSNFNHPLLAIFDSIPCDDANTFTYKDIKITHSQGGGQELPENPEGEEGYLTSYTVDVTTNTYPAKDKAYVIANMDSLHPSLDFPADGDTIH